MVPFGFRWPASLTVQLLWNLWFFGDTTKSIGPFRNICVKADLTVNHDKVRRARCAGVIEKMIAIAVDGGMIARARDVVDGNSQTVFVYAYDQLMTQLYETSRRPEDLVIDTIYNRLKKNMRAANNITTAA